MTEEQELTPEGLDFDLNQVFEDASKILVKDIAPKEKFILTSDDQIKQFINNVAEPHGITYTEAFISCCLLFLKGACNSSAPKAMAVDIICNDGNMVQITKYDLCYACYLATGNDYLRRFAEAMAIPICRYAEKNNLNGDLAIKLNTMALAKEESPLSTKEKAWANSFCQRIENLEEYAGPRIPLLLAADYQKRFSNKKSSTAKESRKAKQENLTPRKWRTGKPVTQTPKQGNADPKKGN